MIEMNGIEAQLAEMERQLEELPKILRGRVMRSGVRKSIDRVRAKAQSNAESIADTGALADSLENGLRVLQKPNKGITYGVIGPAKSYKTVSRTKTKNGQPMVIRPANYAHLVEGQFLHVKTGRTIVGPKPITRAWNATRGGLIPDLIQYIGPRFEKEQKKIANRVQAKAASKGRG